jgi:hypothetical protein
LVYFYQKIQLKKTLIFFLISIIMASCTKEVQIDIPGYEEQLVVDGRIETGGFPIVLLSKSQNVYAPTDVEAYINSFVNDAEISVTNGTQTLSLNLTPISSLPLASRKTLAEMLKVTLNELQLLPIQVYSTTDISIIGEVGKTYTLEISYNGKTYIGSTSLLAPVALNNLYWKADDTNPEYGYSWANLTDPAGEFNGYKWEAKRINKTSTGEDLDDLYRRAGYFKDQYFDGLTFEFAVGNPLKRKDTTHLEAYKNFYRIGDTVVIKLSRLDYATFDFFDKKSAQLGNGGNPFATPVNIPSNISGALGIWAGISSWYDTLACQP